DGAAEDVTSMIELPDGLTFAPPDAGVGAFSVVPTGTLAKFMGYATSQTFDAGDWVCSLDDSAQVADCNLDVLPAGEKAALTLSLVVTTDEPLDPTATTTFTVTHGDQTEVYQVHT